MHLSSLSNKQSKRGFATGFLQIFSFFRIFGWMHKSKRRLWGILTGNPRAPGNDSPGRGGLFQHLCRISAVRLSIRSARARRSSWKRWDHPAYRILILFGADFPENPQQQISGQRKKQHPNGRKRREEQNVSPMPLAADRRDMAEGNLLRIFFCFLPCLKYDVRIIFETRHDIILIAAPRVQLHGAEQDQHTYRQTDRRRKIAVFRQLSANSILHNNGKQDKRLYHSKSSHSILSQPVCGCADHGHLFFVPPLSKRLYQCDG